MRDTSAPPAAVDVSAGRAILEGMPKLRPSSKIVRARTLAASGRYNTLKDLAAAAELAESTLRRHGIRLDPISGPTDAPAVPPLATNPAPLNGRQSLLDGIAGPVEDPARIVLRSVDDAIGALNTPPPMPQSWVVTGRWGGLHTEADTREELLANLGEHAAVDGDDVYLCPCDGDHNPGCDGSEHLGKPCDDDFCEEPCGCEPGCRGKCWENNGEAPDGCWQTITALHDTAMPVVRDQTVGWSRAMWHDHSPGPGGLMVLPKPETNSDFDCWSCGGWNCGGVIYNGDIDIACDFHEDIDDDTQDAIIELWAETGRESLEDASDALDVHS